MHQDENIKEKYGRVINNENRLSFDYGTWLSESVEINANYRDEPVIEWDGSTLKQEK